MTQESSSDTTQKEDFTETSQLGFAPIASEIRRQFDLEMDFDQSSDTKIGIFLGFIVLVIAQVAFNTNLSSANDWGWLQFILYFTGMQWIIISGWKALRAYGPRKYPIGHKLDSLIEYYSQTEKMKTSPVYSEMYISSKIEQASVQVQEIMEEKKRLIHSMQSYFFFGIVIILFSQIVDVVI